MKRFGQKMCPEICLVLAAGKCSKCGVKCKIKGFCEHILGCAKKLSGGICPFTESETQQITTFGKSFSQNENHDLTAHPRPIFLPYFLVKYHYRPG
jgi:hypothetical protein